MTNFYEEEQKLNEVIRNMTKDFNLTNFDMDAMLKKFSCHFEEAKIVKKPKWEKDSYILLGYSKNTQKKIALKIHEEAYPIASHLYNNQPLMLQFNLSKSISNIIFTDTFLSGGGRIIPNSFL